MGAKRQQKKPKRRRGRESAVSPRWTWSVHSIASQSQRILFKIIILDASTSRESVFEQQRELALSLIERLPISRGGTHVAMGINSFTNVPVLRQTLGLGRDRKAGQNGEKEGIHK
jgi:hypothetical protein